MNSWLFEPKLAFFNIYNKIGLNRESMRVFIGYGKHIDLAVYLKPMETIVIFIDYKKHAKTPKTQNRR